MRIITLEDMSNAKNLIESYEENMRSYTIAAGIGSAAGILMTGMSERATPLTIGLATLSGVFYTANIAANKEIGMYEANLTNVAVVGSIGFMNSALTGYLGNRFLGNSNEGKEFDL